MLAPSKNSLFLSLATSTTNPDITSRTLCATRYRISDVLCATLGIVDHGVRIPSCRASIRSLLIFAISLHPVDSFLTGHVPNGSGKTIFAELVAYKVVNIVLELVDLADTGDFGLV